MLFVASGLVPPGRGLITLCSHPLQAATRCDSMTLTPGQWLGLPAVTAATLYRHEDPALVCTVHAIPFSAVD